MGQQFTPDLRGANTGELRFDATEKNRGERCMKASKQYLCAILICTSAAFGTAQTVRADDQTKPGAGNAAKVALAKKSPLVQSAYKFLLEQAGKIKDGKLRKETLDALSDGTCVRHRANLTDAQKDAIIAKLTAQNLVNPADAASIVGSVKAGIFPPLVNDGKACPQLPQKFFSAPGSTSVFGHHSYPGGLPIHEANNETADVHLATEYREIYGNRSGRGGLPTIDPDDIQGKNGRDGDDDATAIFI